MIETTAIKKKVSRKLVFLFSLLCFFSAAQAQDTLRVTLQQADSLFLAKNLLLLAQQFNIAANDALIIQARSYPNPTFTADINVIDPQHNETFHIGKTGQKSFGLEQLIILGGKRRTGIELAKQNKVLAEYEFADLLRNLQSQLRSSFFELYQQRTVIANYNKQLLLLDTLITSYNAQAQRGNVPLKDAIRLKSVYLRINNEKASLSQDYVQVQQQIQLLLQSTAYVYPTLQDNYFNLFSGVTPLNELINLAVSNRPDLKVAEGQEEYSELYLKLQRQMAIPDVALNASYDQRGGAFVNQMDAGLNIPLPLWNRNRGNRKAAEFGVQAAVANQRQAKIIVETDVIGAWQNLSRSMGEYNKIKSIYTDDFELVFKGINTNFKKRNITILEFVDFFEAYNESLTEFARVKTQLAKATGQINFVTASKVY